MRLVLVPLKEVEPFELRWTGTMADLPPDPPDRCRMFAGAVLPWEREAVLAPSRIRSPEFPLTCTPSLIWGCSRREAFTPEVPCPRTPFAARELERPRIPSWSDSRVRLAMASRWRESGVPASTIRLTPPYSRVLVTEPLEPPLVRGRYLAYPPS